ncbi:adenylate/guanylate cyclase domain-containing protein [Nitratireductor sp. XY-223]|uniref:adenylate/guanylate cyclase domain-containing protein n=1 Tax=Nitratireductor sp. XY-223 TaxID=2561926 RepID=UPI0010AA7AC5|nr:adenylate/guanylate cyclase domain-containing protein [Nitratireductor sp. XY-223]
MSKEQSRKLAAIMAADIVDYSRLMAEDEQATLASLRAFRGELLEPSVSEHAGSIIKNMGDGWLAEFDSIVGAVNCATAIQERLSQDGAVEIRIGIHVGDIIHENEDIFGDGVNIAARLQQIAAPGAVIVSGDVYKLIDRKTGTEFEELGIQRLKNITVDTAVYGWAPETAKGESLLSESSEEAAANHVPVVLIEELHVSGSEEEAADMAEEIRYELLLLMSRRTGIKVVSERNDQIEPKYVVGGRCRVSGSKVRFDMTLSGGKGGETIRTERFQSDADDRDEFIERVARRISVMVRSFTTTQDGAEHAERPNAELSVQELLSKAAFLNARWSREGAEGAQAALEKALSKSPDNPMALAMLAMSLLSPLFAGYGRRSEVDPPRVMDLANRAVSLGPQSDVVFMARAFGRLWLHGDYDGARSDIDRALQINPGYQELQAAQGLVEVFEGNAQKGAKYLIDNLDMMSESMVFPVLLFSIGLAYVLAGESETAFQYAREGHERAPFISNCGMVYAASAADKPEITDTREFKEMVERLGIDLTIVDNYPFRRDEDRALLRSRLEAAGVPA